ncbi:hypothetical protein KUTeg_005972 [Tegillarca granosa]|uniref:Uncharacterized protein n=1 Tax=Tegillarca granosa TaxID=220873 RepID=A0ABQ9FJS1_TEGGR|nr:hypothetical protein KUTeg_005972 [Tegillarca granosa]
MIKKYLGKWRWNDQSCKTPLYFACQKSMYYLNQCTLKKQMQTPSEKPCLTTNELVDELIKCRQRCKYPRQR